MKQNKKLLVQNNYIPVCRNCYCNLNSNKVYNKADYYGLAYHV